jgi:CHAT domain-containing protein
VLRSDGGLQLVDLPLADIDLVAVRRAFEREVAWGTARRQAHESWLRLSSAVIDPILDHVHDGDLLLLAPHGPLHGLPLHALLAGPSRVIERFPVAYLPSASALPEVVRRGRRATDGAAVLGAHFEDEARAVARILGTAAVVPPALDKDAVAAALRERAIVHLSTHGFYVADDPSSSGLLLADSEPANAYVEAVRKPAASMWWGQRLDIADLQAQTAPAILAVDDLASLDVGARLVTLSACESGVVGTDAADDPVGLVPGLLAAGASGVVATLWLVNADATAELMRHFYTAVIAAGTLDRLPDCLQDAILALHATHPDAHAWASVILVGGVTLESSGGR